MNIEIINASVDEKPQMKQMLEFYVYEFSVYEDLDIDENGYFGYSNFNRYWEEPDRFPFVVRSDGKLAGFVFVNKATYIPSNEWAIGEFFIMRKYRRRGIGKQAAFSIFDKYLGKWEVREIEANKEAHQFWIKVISEYTNGQYSEINANDDKWKGPIQSFDNKIKV